ncbi:MAG: hypothetical protein FJ023_08595 [Chloroflexi bacterium]|nr:hypothetical protein [Chloroflexota bacterium]
MELADIFPLKPDLEKQFRPEALEHLNEWRAEILKDVPELSQLSKDEAEADLHKYLTDSEKAGLQRYSKEIAEWLWHCTRNQNIPFFMSLPLIYLPKSEIKRLIRQTYDRKAKEAEEERRAQEAKLAEEEQERNMQRRIQTAMKGLNPPEEKAQRYLDKNEYRQFNDSAARALISYTTHGENYLSDPQSLPYLRWVEEIKARQDKEERRKRAGEKAKQYNRAFNKELARLKAELLKEQQDTESYFKAHVGDLLYLPLTSAFVSSAQGEQRRDAIVEQKVAEIFNRQFDNIITTRHRTSYFLIPFAEFCADDVLHLKFFFNVYAVVEVEVWLEPGEGTIDGFIFTFPWIEHKTDYGMYLEMAPKTQLLGYQYLLLTPSDLGHFFWRSLPLDLVIGLMSGEMEPEGTSIIELSENYTTYSVDGLDDEVVILERFIEYLKELGGIEGMVDAGVIGDKVASVIRKRLEKPQALPAPPLLLGGDASCFEKEEFVSALTGLGIPRKDAEELFAVTPTNIPLNDAIRLALRNYKDHIS